MDLIPTLAHPGSAPARSKLGTSLACWSAPANGLGFGLSIDIPIHDRNKGEIARSQVALAQAHETESAVLVGVLTDVANAYVGEVTIGHAPRLGEFGYMDQDDAVEGVILMRTGEQAQVVLKKVEEATRELNTRLLPPDVKVVPYNDRQDLLRETTKTVGHNLVLGMVLVLVVLGLLLFSVRTALSSRSRSRSRCSSRSSASTGATFPPTCCRSARSTSASSWTPRS